MSLACATQANRQVTLANQAGNAVDNNEFTSAGCNKHTPTINAARGTGLL